MIKYYDQKNQRLVSIESAATPEFWGKHWGKNKDLKKSIIAGAGSGLIKKFTGKFLKPPLRQGFAGQAPKILDAGCGIGQNVYGLSKWGYDAYGIDFAADAVKNTLEIFPDLKISVQDVRHLDFSDNFFDGVWSLGVIEHFKEGYTDILKESARVIKKDGFLYLTVPWFSPLRRLKARLGRYPKFSDQVDMADFYEFMLDDSRLKRDVESAGFKLVSRHPYDAVKGLKDEIPIIRPLLQKIYDSRSVFAKALRFGLTLFFAPFAGHIILLVFKKHEESI